MGKKAFTAAIFISLILATVVAGMQTVEIVTANPIGLTPAPDMPILIIGSDGRISPENPSVARAENRYWLTADLIGFAIKIESEQHYI